MVWSSFNLEVVTTTWSSVDRGYLQQCGHFEILKWARSQTSPCPWDIHTCQNAAGGGHLEILKWARSQTPPCPWDRVKTFQAASRQKHIHIQEWMMQNGFQPRVRGQKHKSCKVKISSSLTTRHS
jgi:hypothetical protein